MIRIRCRLAELLNEKRVTPEELATASGIPIEKIDVYYKGNMDSISIQEIGIILSSLGCTSVSDLLEEDPVADDSPVVNDAPPMVETEWDSPCPDSPNGKHTWYKDLAVSDTIYQEFTCKLCGQRLSVIL